MASHLRTSREQSFYGKTRRDAISLDCELTYLPLPMVTGEDLHGNPVVQMLQWPFVLPHLYVA